MPETIETTSLLPTEKTPASVDPLRKKILLYGQPKIGKSTLAAQLDPEHTLFLATEPGLDALDVFRVDVKTWAQFREVGAALATEEHPYKLVVIDTIDALHGLCVEYVLAGLGGDRKTFVHASDFDYGKGWDAISSEFRLRVAKLCNLGMGVVFISHVKESSVKKANGLEITKLSPDVGQKGSRKWLLGFVDYIFMADILPTADGETRVIRTQPTENVEAGGRVPPGSDPLPDIIPLSAAELRAALEALSA